MTKAVEYRLKRVYGITLDQYMSLLTNQGGCCAVCRRDHKMFNRRLSVDHNHETGEIRGLLCLLCNYRLVGRHKQGVLLRSAADYLDKPGTGWFVPPKIKKKRKTKK